MTSNLKRNDVVQIDPAHDDVFGGCFMTVSEPKSWGAMGYVKFARPPEDCKPGENSVSLAWYRCPHEAMTLIGSCEWGLPDEDNVNL